MYIYICVCVHKYMCACMYVHVHENQFKGAVCVWCLHNHAVINVGYF